MVLKVMRYYFENILNFIMNQLSIKSSLYSFSLKLYGIWWLFELFTNEALSEFIKAKIYFRLFNYLSRNGASNRYRFERSVIFVGFLAAPDIWTFIFRYSALHFCFLHIVCIIYELQKRGRWLPFKNGLIKGFLQILKKAKLFGNSIKPLLMIFLSIL